MITTIQYPAPRWPVVAWFLHVTAPPDIQDGLRATLFRRMSSLAASALVAWIIVVLALYRHRSAPFVAWAVVDGGLAALRLVIILQIYKLSSSWTDRRKSVLVDIFIASSLLWCLQIGLGGLLCMVSGDLVLIFFSGMLCVGIVGALSARNPGAPRLSVAQMVLVIVPFAAGSLLCPEPLVWLTVIMAPAFMLGMASINRQLHADYVGMLTAQRDNRHLALHCGLTGLPNRTNFDESLRKTIQAADRQDVSVLCLDLDGLKAVNDEYGHLVGDAVLRAVADRIRLFTAPSAFAARLGGDEFAVILQQTSKDDLDTMTKTLIEEIGRPYSIAGGSEATIGVSIGVATSRSDIADPTMLLWQADQALYAAKNAGKGVCRRYSTKAEMQAAGPSAAGPGVETAMLRAM